MDLDVGVLQRQRGIGRHTTSRVAIARQQEIQPDRGVDEGSRLEVLRVGARAQAGEEQQPHERHHTARRRAPPGTGPRRGHGGGVGWVSLKTLVPEPGTTWQGTGIAFKGRHRQLPCTLLVRWEAGYTAPWLLLTDLPLETSTACWYGLWA
jgi:hypothetical protein